MQAMLDDECDFAEDIINRGKVDLSLNFDNGKTHRQLVWDGDGFEKLRDRFEESTFTSVDVCNTLKKTSS